MLHPVGPLPARVYWRRRALVLGLLVSLLGGGGATGWAAATGRLPLRLRTAAAEAPAPVADPSLAAVLPPLVGVRLPLVPAASTAPSTAPTAAPTAPPTAPSTTPPSAGLLPALAGPPCADDQIDLLLSAPGTVTVGGAAALTLTATDTASLPCVRDLGTAQVEVVLVDGAGARLWSSADCAPDAGSAPRLLVPGQPLPVGVAWTGRTSAAGCAGVPTVVPAGSYVLHARVGTRTAPDVPITLG